MPLFHSGGAGWALCGMINGCKSVTIRQFEARSVLATIQREQVTISMFVPAMLAAMRAVPDAREMTGSVRQINYTGSPKSGRAHVELQSLMRLSYAAFCLRQKTQVNI